MDLEKKCKCENECKIREELRWRTENVCVERDGKRISGN